MPGVASALIALAFALAAYRLATQPAIVPVLWTPDASLPRAAGVWALTPDNHLVDARFDSWNGTAVGPEAFAVDEATGTIYASVSFGVVIVPDDPAASANPVFFAPAAVDGWAGPASEHALFELCRARAQARDLVAEERCGRPLGIRVVAGVLYIADAYFGIFSIVLGREPALPERLVSPADAVPPLRFFNDLDVLRDGTLIFSDSSVSHPRHEAMLAVFENRADGRLFVKAPGAPLALLADGLHFPNGVQAVRGAGGQEQVVVAELGRRRLLLCLPLPPSPDCRIGRLPPACSELAPNLPCVPDNVRLGPAAATAATAAGDGSGVGGGEKELWVACGSTAFAPFALLDFLWARPALAALAHRALTFFPGVEEAVQAAVSRYTLVLRVSPDDGRPLGSLHAPDGWGGVSTALVAGGHLWLGSPFATHVTSLPWPPPKEPHT